MADSVRGGSAERGRERKGGKERGRERREGERERERGREREGERGGREREREREGERGGRERERERERERVNTCAHQINEYTILPLLVVAVCAESADSGSSKISGCSSSVVVVVGSSSVGVASSEDGVSYNQNTIIILFQLLLVQKIRIKLADFDNISSYSTGTCIHTDLAICCV